MKLAYATIALGIIWILDNIARFIFTSDLSPSLPVGVICLAFGIWKYNKEKKKKLSNIE